MKEEYIKQAAEEFGVPEKVIRRIYRLMWTFILGKIQNFPKEEILTVPEFRELRTSFSFKGFGKLRMEYARYINRAKWLQRKRELEQNENIEETDPEVHQGPDNSQP